MRVKDLERKKKVWREREEKKERERDVLGHGSTSFEPNGHWPD
jgi:hypothetical protein